MLLPISAGYYAGGLDAPVIPLVVLFPLVAGFVAGQRAAIVFSCAASLVITFFFLAKKYEILPPSQLTSDLAVNQAKFVVILAVLAFALGMAFLYERIRKSELEARRLLEFERAFGLRNAKLASLGEMAAGLAHEINNPLTIVGGTVRALPKFANDPKKLHEKTQVVIEACDRIARIISSLKKFARITGEKTFEVCLVKNVLEEVVLGAKEHAGQMGVRLEVECVQKVSIYCDAPEIVQALVNVVNNGIEASTYSKSKCVHISVSSDSGNVDISIWDSGAGISPEIEDKIFEPFVSTKRGGHGPGLGLSVVKGILDDHGGRIDVMDSGAQGTLFRLRLPSASQSALERLEDAV